MSTKREIIETVVHTREYDGEWPPTEATAFLGWLSAKLAVIPEDRRYTARVELGVMEDYDCFRPSIDISFSRLETDAEVESRIAAEQAEKRNREARERAEFERLRAKFEN